MRYPANNDDACPAFLPAIPSAHGVFGDAAADDGHHALARHRIHPRSLHRLRLRRWPADRCLRSGVHSARLVELHRCGRHGVDHFYRDLHPLPGRKARARGAGHLLDHHHRDDHGADCGHDHRGNFHSAICRMDVPRLHTRADAALRASHPHPAARADFLLRRRSRLGSPALASPVSSARIRPAHLQRLHHRWRSNRRPPIRHRVAGLRRADRQHRRAVPDQRHRRRRKSAPAIDRRSI